ncbi:MAG: DinB family protein [Gammaproteobacteria bacterium]
MELDEIIVALSGMPGILRSKLDGLSDEQLRFQAEAGNFSILENICHLRDIEIEGYSLRLKRLLAERHPRLPDINGGPLALERHYNRQPLQPAVDAFIQARHANLKLFEKLTAAQLARTGILEPIGEITLVRLLELWVEHDQGHIRELEKLRTAARGSHSTPKPKPPVSRQNLR